MYARVFNGSKYYYMIIKAMFTRAPYSAYKRNIYLYKKDTLRFYIIYRQEESALSVCQYITD